VDIVVEFGRSKGYREKCYWVKFVINDDRKDSSESIIGGIGFHHKLMVQKPMVEDWSLGRGLL